MTRPYLPLIVLNRCASAAYILLEGSLVRPESFIAEEGWVVERVRGCALLLLMEVAVSLEEEGV